MQETKEATEHSTDNDALWEDGYKELSVDDICHPGLSDRQYTIPSDKIKCCLVFSEIKIYEPIIKCLNC
jgi:hypothetical protein